MSFEQAYSIVESYLSNPSNDEYDECVIEFFGGEPFLNFPLIKQVCETVWAKKWEKPYLFHAASNGTLIHGEIRDWLLTNKHRFIVSVSLDGTAEMHNINRSQSFSKIDLEFFQSTWADPSTKMTVSKESLPYLADGVIYLHSLGFTVDNNLAYGIDWSDSSTLSILARELRKLAEYYLAHPEIKPCSLLDMKIEMQTFEAKKWCGAGTQMIAYDVDGVDYPCQMLLPMSIGKEKAEQARHIDFQNVENFIDGKCKNCLLFPICPTCYGSNFDERDNLATRNDHLCEITKVRALASAYLQAKKVLNKKDIQDLEGNEYLIVKAALEIQRKIDVNSDVFVNN
jgi:radical SAM protein with 4Fe4S-binding SPASM domain